MLEWCAHKNAQGDADWRLVFCLDRSLRVQFDLRSDAFWSTQLWWTGTEHFPWTNSRVRAGYHLLDFGRKSQGRFGGMSWSEQNDLIRCGEYAGAQRADEAVVSQAVTTIMATHSEVLLADWYHWGLGLNGVNRAGVGPVYSGPGGGLRVTSFSPIWSGDDKLRVVLEMPPDVK